MSSSDAGASITCGGLRCIGGAAAGTPCTTPGLGDPACQGVPCSTVGEPTKGNYTITSQYKDGTYWFSSEEHKAAFDADPEAYVPQYGGYCAFGAAMGFKFDGDPNYWKVVDGELFLNLSEDVQARWQEDIPGFIDLADNNWVTIEGKEPSELQ